MSSLVQHRSYIWSTALADLRTRYVGSGLGIAWNVVQPLAQILIFTMIFGTIMHREQEGGPPYALYLCAALLPWNAFAECLTRSTHSLVSHAMYLRKLPIPEQVFIAQAALGSLFSLGISFGLLVMIAAIMGHTPTWHWLLIPVPLAMLMALGFGLGMGLGAMFPFIRDIGQLLPIALQLGFWLYPIVYELRMVPDWLQRLIPFNPVYPFFESIRALFLSATLPSPGLWGAMALWCGLALGLGGLVLRKLKPEIRDVI
jgi:lipopolysaccharide transport system permease protein